MKNAIVMLFITYQLIWHRIFSTCGLCLLYSLSIPQGAANPMLIPQFLPTRTNVTFHVGDLAVLPCAIKDLGTKTVIWRKQPYKIPITVGKELFVKELERFKLDHVAYKDEWNLLIEDVQQYDSGTYECQVSSKEGSYRQNVTLHVTVTNLPTRDRKENKFPGKNIVSDASTVNEDIQISGTQFVEKGDHIYLECNATSAANPPQSIDWFKDGSAVQSSVKQGIYIREQISLSTKTIVSALEIQRARMSDTGVYVCRVSDTLATRIKVDVLNAETFNEKRNAHYGESESSGSTVNVMNKEYILLTFMLWILLRWLTSEIVYISKHNAHQVIMSNCFV
ncbi:hypothetical protein ACJMK2_043182 [Sinanodonta woodiana]|uniref:Ig-like domain-containing protein n=1 Tax=Sinanodonta woodiana TaxID=1069815 RepID=A0ABD3VW47_SINWO